MRRSKSSTSIPVRSGLGSTNLFGANRDNKLPLAVPKEQRSRSASRGSSLGFKRNPSLDRCTPLSQKGVGSGGKQLGFNNPQKKSWTPCTPSTYGDYKRSGSSSSSRSTYFNKGADGSADKRILQKQINNKKWVAEKYAKVQEFIHTSGLFDPQLASQIRPPTIKNFVEICSGLFNEIYPIRININTQNYAEMTVQNLKLLQYPGAITISAVKTANTMHGWPNFIAMTSWLVEKVSLALNPGLAFEDRAEDQQMITHLLSVSYANWVPADNEPVNNIIPEDLNSFKMAYARLFEVDYEADEKLSKEIEGLESEVLGKNQEIEELEARKEEILEEIHYKKGVINEYQCDTGEKQEKLDRQLAKFKKIRDEKREKERELKGLVNHLSSQVETQSCKLNDKRRMLKEVERYKKDKERRRAKILEYYKIREEMDLNYQRLLSQLNQEVDSWNVAITKTFLPEMQNLRLRDKGYHSDMFLEEIREKKKQRDRMEEAFAEEAEKIQVEIEDLEKRQTELISVNKNFHDLLNRIKELEREKKELVDEISKAEAQHNQNLALIEERLNDKLSKEAQEIGAEEKRYHELCEKFQSLAKKGVTAMLETHIYVSKKIVECQELATKVKDLKVDHVQHLSEVLEKKLNELKNLKILMENSEQEWNAPLFEEECDSI